ncbi:MAG: hypothetical protein Q8M86_09230 [Syntrophales bacterium]|nr:hypothetical protein [Syntrophales bacterium]MDP3098115.1 hypothetical protein [Syntrophales bacterium]
MKEMIYGRNTDTVFSKKRNNVFIMILVSMTALIAIFLFSDFFYGGQDVGFYLFGAVLCGVFVYSANCIGKLGLPFSGGDDFNGHNLPFGHFDWPKRSEYTVFKNGLNDLGHAITTLLNCFALFYHGNKFLSKIANTGADIKATVGFACRCPPKFSKKQWG